VYLALYTHVTTVVPEVKRVVRRMLGGRAMAAGRLLYGRPITTAQSLFGAIDRDNTATITRAVCLACGHDLLANPNVLSMTFIHMLLCWQELESALDRLGYGLDNAQLDHMFSRLDNDGSGVITRDNFLAAMGHFSAKRRHVKH
jgi:hypothetical protein